MPKSSHPTEQNWHIYILLCADNSLYTGITTNLKRRLEEHNSEKKSARYTRARQPVRLVYSEPSRDRSSAAKREAAIKRLSAAQKRQLIQSGQ